MYQRLGLVREYFGRDLGRPLTHADNGRFNVTFREGSAPLPGPDAPQRDATAPYQHHGSRATLDEAVCVMGRHQPGRRGAIDRLYHRALAGCGNSQQPEPGSENFESLGV